MRCVSFFTRFVVRCLEVLEMGRVAADGDVLDLLLTEEAAAHSCLKLRGNQHIGIAILLQQFAHCGILCVLHSTAADFLRGNIMVVAGFLGAYDQVGCRTVVQTCVDIHGGGGFAHGGARAGREDDEDS